MARNGCRPPTDQGMMKDFEKDGRRMARGLGLAALSALLALGPVKDAFAQAGSTGGVIGKTDKSVSGERAPEPRASAKSSSSKGSAKTSSCSSLAGVWGWWNNLEVTIRAGGTMSATNGDGGTWTCNGNQAVLNWRFGQDFLSLSDDGKRLTGTNTYGQRMANTRK